MPKSTLMSFRYRERGAALLVALLAAIVIALAGSAYLMMTSTESRIARNETVAVQARHAAEVGARAVQAWFERPGIAPGFPQDPSAISRQREILDESDPYGAPLAADGPQYKEQVDLDGDGRDDLFDRPFRGSPVDELLGSEESPDMRIEDLGFLDQLSRKLYRDFPGAGLRARIRSIDVYSPPYVRRDSGWVRRGMGTIKVVAGIYAGAELSRSATLAERSIRIVLSETPYAASVHGAVHSCGDAAIAGEIGVRWGTLSAVGDISVVPSELVVPWSLPRAPADGDGAYRLWTDDPVWISAFNTSVGPAEDLGDPWLRLVAGGSVLGAPSAADQPYAGASPPAPGTPPPWSCCDRSNVFQHQAWVGCPQYDYRFWKDVSRSGRGGAHYYSWTAPDGFLEGGVGPPRTFEQIFAEADGEPGLYFFDTADGRAPHDDDGDGTYDNLTPEIHVGSGWRARGFLFVNAEKLSASGLVDTLPETLRAPAEPFVGAQDAWIDLSYPLDLDLPYHPGGPAEWSPRGPAIDSLATFRGILVTHGAFEASTGGTFYGSVVARTVVLDGSNPPATRFYWDASLGGNWPPDGWRIPRLIVTSVALD